MGVWRKLIGFNRVFDWSGAICLLDHQPTVFVISLALSAGASLDLIISSCYRWNLVSVLQNGISEVVSPSKYLYPVGVETITGVPWLCCSRKKALTSSW